MTPYTLDDAERDYAAALATGDQAAIDRAARAVDRLDPALRPSEPSPLLGAALWYAEQGMAVFPLTPGSKVPLPRSRGFKDATTDTDTIRTWWAVTPDANIGLPTGITFDAVDIDGHVGQKSRVTHWDAIFARIDADAIAKVLTPSAGGMHIYVPPTGDGNSTGIVPSVDYRGLGGYVVAPPSRTPEGAYRFLGTPRLATDLAKAG